jgi:hypothetical protein
MPIRAAQDPFGVADLHADAGAMFVRERAAEYIGAVMAVDSLEDAHRALKARIQR